MDYKGFYKWVYSNLGIDLESYKQGQLTRRLDNFLKRLELNDLNEFIKVMEKNPEYKEKFLDFLTINVTEFFRNPELYKRFEKAVEKQFINKNHKLKIWSAACSYGCEPYSIAILLKEKGYRNFTIIATDLDRNIIKIAQRAVYSSNDIKNLPREYLKYFKKEGNDFYLSDEIKRLVNFKRQDLILDSYEKNFDLILCRNVVIYFNNEVKDKIYEKISNSLNKGGLFFVGATESIQNFKELAFDKESTFIYKKL